MRELAFLGPLGLSIPALLLAAFLARELGRLTFRGGRLRDQILGGVTSALALLVLGLQIAFHANFAYAGTLLALLVLVTGGVVVLRRRYAPEPAPSFRSSRPFDAFVAPTFFVTLAGLGVALLAAYWLPVWPWDSLGYHLPFVNFVLQGGGKAELPYDVPYLSTYPRNVELLFVGLRATLPDDRFVDLGQVPFGIVAALATFGIGRELGASRSSAGVAACLFLTLPAVYLQLPTNYIDVATASFFLLTAYFLLVPTTRASLIHAGLGLGLFLGTKPSAPPAAALLGLALLLRARYPSRPDGPRSAQSNQNPWDGTGSFGVGVIAVLLAGVLGLEAYLIELHRHGNPVWPAIVRIGPFELPGTISVKELLSSGAGAQKVHGSLLSRIVQSWSSFDAMPLFDMRVGGLRAAFWFSLPLALVLLVRQRRLVFGALCLVALVTPDPAVVRYVLPLPALLLSGAAACVTELGARFASDRRLFLGLATATSLGCALLALSNVVYAAPGLIGEGPPLRDYARMSWAERERAVGANGSPKKFVDARELLAAGQVAVYDRALWLPYSMWRSDLSNRVVRIPDDASAAAIEALLAQPEVRIVAAGKDQTVFPIVKRDPRYRLLFDCPEPCAFYFRP